MKIIPILLIFISMIFFFKTSDFNYNKHLEIQDSIIEHPKFLPKKDTLKYTSFWFANIRSDLYWLRTIQYIWWNAINNEYKKYLFNMIEIINYLNPYFEHPYLIWQLLLPGENKRYENLSNDELINNNLNATLIWLKGVENFCDKNKLELIKEESNLEKIWKEEKYQNPCKSYMIPYYLWYVYFQYLKDPLKSSLYYKIASANVDSLEWVKLMTAIMHWKSWNREKSILMFLNLAKSMPWDELCNNFSEQIEKIYIWIINNKVKINWNIVKDIEILRNKIYWENISEYYWDKSSCSAYLLKASREINLHYIEEANKKYKKDKWTNAKDDYTLFKEWYIDFLPTDYQQNDWYWINYVFNEEINNFDYKMNYR